MRQETDTAMKDQTKDKEKTPAKRPKVRVIIQLKKVPHAVKGHIEVSCEENTEGIVK